MPRKEKGAPTETLNMRIPRVLLEEVNQLIRDGCTPYSDRSDLVKSAIRKEVEYLQRRQAGPIIGLDDERREFSSDRPKRRSKPE